MDDEDEDEDDGSNEDVIVRPPLSVIVLVYEVAPAVLDVTVIFDAKAAKAAKA
jgi:hypothetical protein